jgi:hypothetical protein
MMRVLIIILIFFCANTVGQGGIFDRSHPKTDNAFSFLPTSQTRAPELPKRLDFAGENVPLQYFDIRESLERELIVNVFWQSQTLMLIKLANRYFPVIEPILREQNVPDDFKYLCVAESGLQHVVSPAKAAGFWQIIPATGKELGLEINEEVDERYHIEISTLAACAFLKKSYELYGTWNMAAASYNMGTAALTQQVLVQKTSSYYNLRLNHETSRYVFRMLALKLILSHPEQYGFFVKKEELYQPFRYKQVRVDTAITSLADFAAQHGTNYKMLKLLNTWLREPFLTNKKGKTYYIKILEEGFRENTNK